MLSGGSFAAGNPKRSTPSSTSMNEPKGTVREIPGKKPYSHTQEEEEEKRMELPDLIFR